MNDNDKKVRFLRTALYFTFGAFMVLWILAFMQGCTPATTPAANSTSSAATTDNRVVLYCSVDDVYAKPLIKKLEAQTGLQIDALFDTEATKTAGLANRIRAERSRPRADVFWSSATLQTLLMSQEGLLHPYQSAATKGLPEEAVSKDWAGVGVRARVLLSSKPQKTIAQPFEAKMLNSQLGISNPQFGTASDWATELTHRAAATAPTTQERTPAFFDAFKGKGVRVFPGNGDVARAVADGNLLYGWSDSDDFLAQKREKKMIYLVQTSNDNVLVPGAVSIIKGAPHLENAQKLFDAIVSTQNEKALTETMPGVFSLRHLKEKSNFQSGGQDFSFIMDTPMGAYETWPAIWTELREPLNRIFTTQ